MKKINNAEGKFTLEYTIQNDYEIFFTVHSENLSKKYSENTFTQFTGDTYKSYFSFPEQGRYSVRIFWKKIGENTGKGCGEFGIISSKGNSTLYPKQYASSGRNVQVIGPIEMPLEKGKAYDFKIKTDNKNCAAFIYENDFIQLEKNTDGIFCKEIIIPKSVNNVSIGIADTEIGSYEIILEYTVK